MNIEKSQYFFQFAFLEAANKVRAYEKKMIKKLALKVTPKELSYIALIGEMRKKGTLKDLLGHFAISKGTASNMITLLETKKLVKQSVNLHDKRIKNIYLTSEGKKVFAGNKKIRDDIKTYIEKRLSKDEINIFIKLALKLR